MNPVKLELCFLVKNIIKVLKWETRRGTWFVCGGDRGDGVASTLPSGGFPNFGALGHFLYAGPCV